MPAIVTAVNQLKRTIATGSGCVCGILMLTEDFVERLRCLALCS